MRHIETNPFIVAQRFIGTKEVRGKVDNPQIMAMLNLDNAWPEHDEVPWCSAFANYVCWLLRLPRSKNLRARSWLLVGEAVEELDAEVGSDVVIIKRGSGDQPGPEVIEAPGHVGFFAGVDGDFIHMLGGNQGDGVSVARFPRDQLLGIRRLF